MTCPLFFFYLKNSGFAHVGVPAYILHFDLCFGKSCITSKSTSVRRKKSLIEFPMPGTKNTYNNFKL